MDLAGFSLALQSCFEGSRIATGVQEIHRVAGLDYAVDFAHSGLAERLGRASAHTRVTEGEPGFRILVWDGSGGARLPFPPWNWDLCDPRTGFVDLNHDDYFVHYDVAFRHLQFVDRARGLGFLYCPSGTDLPFWRVAAPYSFLLNHFLTEAEVQILHAGLLAHPKTGAGIVMCGPSGSGKSTTCLRAAARGFEYLADDYCALQNGVGYSLYQSAKLFWPVCRELGLESLVSNTAREEKAVLFADQPPFVRRLSCKVEHLVYLRVAQRERCQLTPISSAQGLLALAPSTLLQLRDNRALTLQSIRRHTQGIGCWQLDLSPDEDDIMNCLLSLGEAREVTCV